MLSFYQHPPASHERVAKPQYLDKSHLDISVAEKGFGRDDLSPMSTTDKNPFCSTISVNTNKECTMWPSRQTLATTKLSEKKKKRSSRFCACAGVRHNWEQLHKNHRLTVRIVIALILIGAMIGLGVGISKAVHGSYYSGSGSSTTT
ncbi:hypothetical protein AMS68_005778 [Peltaster fructicola]|uniref:Uncharacterized protein n=1 Tax=Peltaster fructicola TaxID=286661 RepID=A0A6H0Y019_9PEZI|nr:hypothetical protein AMS68_005778 [Peltaster fructicola]